MSEAMIAAATTLTGIQADQDRAVANDVAGLFATHGGDAKATHLLLPEIIDQHAQVASQITAQWYDDLDPGSKFRAKPFADIPREQITKTIDWALYAPGDEPPQNRLTSSSQRIVRNTSRATITRNAATEGVLWARFARAEACAYCRALAMRGSGRSDRKWLYHSEQSAIYRKSDGEKYHDDCYCTPVAVRGGQIWTPPGYTADWDSHYDAAVKKVKTPKGNKNYFKDVVAQIRSDYGEHLVETPEQTAAAQAKQAAADAADQAEIDAADALLQETLAATLKLNKAKALKALDTAQDWAAIEKVAKKILPDTDIDFSSPPHEVDLGFSDLGNDAVRDVVRAVDDVLTAYPAMKLEALALKQLPKNGTYAQEEYWPGRKYRRITMNRRFADLPGVLINSWNGNVADGFHHPGSESPAYNVIVHEMGHAMEDLGIEAGVTIDDFTVMTALSDYYKATRPPVAGQSTRERELEFRAWLLAGVSGYSRQDPYGNSIALNIPEALGEAFADVFINGDDAQEPSKVMHKVLTDALEGVSYWDARNGPVAQAA